MIKFDPFWTDLIKKIKIKRAIFILSVYVTNFYRNIFRLVRYSNLILFDQVWSSLIHFGQIWSKKIKNKTAIFILSVNVTNFYRNIFRLVRKSNLIQFDQTFDEVWLSLMKFDQVWSILDRSDPKKIKYKRAIFILSLNVTHFYSNIFRLVRKSIWSSLIQKNQKQKSHFYPFCKCDKFL